MDFCNGREDSASIKNWLPESGSRFSDLLPQHADLALCVEAFDIEALQSYAHTPASIEIALLLPSSKVCSSFHKDYVLGVVSRIERGMYMNHMPCSPYSRFRFLSFTSHRAYISDFLLALSVICWWSRRAYSVRHSKVSYSGCGSLFSSNGSIAPLFEVRILPFGVCCSSVTRWTRLTMIVREHLRCARNHRVCFVLRFAISHKEVAIFRQYECIAHLHIVLPNVCLTIYTVLISPETRHA
nr:hypothetical protein CFP56_30040 [Quercus suber]